MEDIRHHAVTSIAQVKVDDTAYLHTGQRLDVYLRMLCDIYGGFWAGGADNGRCTLERCAAGNPKEDEMKQTTE